MRRFWLVGCVFTTLACSSPSEKHAAAGKRSNVSPPEGVALRLKKGQGIQINMHFINTGDETVNGNGVIDLKLAPPDPSKPAASLFANNVADIAVPPNSGGTASVDCHIESEIRFVMVGNPRVTDATPAVSQERLRSETRTWTPPVSQGVANCVSDLRRGRNSNPPGGVGETSSGTRPCEPTT